MNNLYRIGFQKVWPILSDAKKVLLSVQNQVTFKKLEIRPCQYCKKYGLYDDEDEDSFGEYNNRGVYIDHRSARLESNDRYSSDDYDDKKSGFKRHPNSRNRFEPRNQMRFDDFPQRPFERRTRDHSYNDFFSRGAGSPRKKQTFDNNLEPVEKNFYREHADVAARSMEEVEEYRKAHNMTLRGSNIPKPITSFKELSVPENLLHSIRDQKFSEPTAIQAQGWPIALSGRDMIGISQTGSGKTLVFALPAMLHLMNQPKPPKSFNEATPQALVLAPTRELAQQIHQVCSKFYHFCGINSSCAYGGAAKGPQLSRMQNSQLCVATPGRLNDFLSEGAVNLTHCTYLVLDEADRMLDMGFEPQIRSIIEQTRPDRQTLMWSATWPKEVQTLAEDFLSDYVQVTIGSEELSANPNIQQNIYMIPREAKNQKFVELLQQIKVQDDCKTLVFAQTKRAVDYLADSLNRRCGILAMAIHGDVSQSKRDRVLRNFRQQPASILIATDVAARGIDVSDISHIINYDMPQNIEDYIHRIGRTARGSKKGIAHSFFTPDDVGMAKDLLDVLKKAGQSVEPELLELANRGARSKRDYGYFRSGGGRRDYGRNRYY